MVMNTMVNPNKCRDCDNDIKGQHFWHKQQNTLPDPAQPGFGPLCWGCYRKRKYPQHTDNTLNKNGTAPVKVNEVRDRESPTAGGARGER